MTPGKARSNSATASFPSRAACIAHFDQNDRDGQADDLGVGDHEMMSWALDWDDLDDRDDQADDLGDGDRKNQVWPPVWGQNPY